MLSDWMLSEHSTDVLQLETCDEDPITLICLFIKYNEPLLSKVELEGEDGVLGGLARQLPVLGQDAGPLRGFHVGILRMEKQNIQRKLLPGYEWIIPVHRWLSCLATGRRRSSLDPLPEKRVIL